MALWPRTFPYYVIDLHEKITEELEHFEDEFDKEEED